MYWTFNENKKGRTKMKNFKGIFPALLTPFDNNDNVNTAQLSKLVEMNIVQGVDGGFAGLIDLTKVCCFENFHGDYLLVILS